MTPYENLLALMQSRRSIRRFAGRPVSRGDLARLLEAARWAPSNHNRQPWKFVVLEDPARIRALAGAVEASLEARLKSLPAVAVPYAAELARHAAGFGGAPALIFALHKRPVSVASALLENVPNPALVSGEPLSVAMAVQNLLLAASALGLGACVLTAPLLAHEVVAQTLRVPAGFEVTCLVAVGHPAESPEPPRRKRLEHIVQYLDDAAQTDDAPRQDP
jgi:nitroreductase